MENWAFNYNLWAALLPQHIEYFTLWRTRRPFFMVLLLSFWHAVFNMSKKIMYRFILHVKVNILQLSSSRLFSYFWRLPTISDRPWWSWARWIFIDEWKTSKNLWISFSCSALPYFFNNSFLRIGFTLSCNCSWRSGSFWYFNISSF